MQFNPAHYPQGMWGMAYAALNSAGAAPLFDVLVSQFCAIKLAVY